MTMTYEEKLDLIINEIVEARKRTRAGQPAKIFVDKRSEILRYIILQEVYDILLKLQDDEKIIKVQSFPSDLDERFVADLNPNTDHFAIKILSSFDNWYEKYLIAKKSKLENLSETNFNNINHITHLIEERLELDQSEKLTIDFVSSLEKLKDMSLRM